MDELLKPEEVAALLRTSLKAVYTMAERGKLPGAIKVGTRLLVRAVDIRKHLGLSTAPPNDSESLSTRDS